MRILIANPSRQLLGGVEQYLETLMPALVRRGHSLAVLHEYSSESGTPGIDRRTGPLPSWCSNELGREAALEAISDWNPDVVYSQGFDDREMERALQHSYHAILYAHTYYGTCITGRKCYSQPHLEPCSRRFGTACLSLFYPRRCGGLNPLTMWQLFQIQSRRNASLADYHMVLVASSHMYREYERHGVRPEQLQLLPLYPTNCVPESRTPPLRNPSGRILFVGRLMDVKGVDHLLQAMPLATAALARPLHLTIAGDGPDREKLEHLARPLGSAVEFIGWIDSERRADLMRQADLLAVPSLWPEPFGLAGLEAGCFGLPAVGYATGGISEWLIPGQTGELAPAHPPTAQGLAEAIVRAIEDPVHHQKLRVGAWELAKKFSLDRHVEQLEQILAARPSAAQLSTTVA